MSCCPVTWCLTTSSNWALATRFDQIVVDGVVIEESALEVDESLLTGEGDPVLKRAGDPVMSGSFVVAGTGACRVTKVGRDAYAAQLTQEASTFTLARSELRIGINKILQ